MSNKVKLAVAQLGPNQPDMSRAENVNRLCDMMREAASAGAKIITFPELALTAFFPRHWIENEAELNAYYETSMPSPVTQQLFDLSRDLDVSFYLGYAELTEDGHRFNTSILVRAGEIIGKYRKIHLPGHSEYKKAPFQHLEKRYFEVGDLGLPVFEDRDLQIGMCLCNDRRWPETFRVMSLQGAELVMLGYNTPVHNIHWSEPEHLRMFHNRLVLQAAAYQNSLWLCAAAKAGTEDGSILIGGSCIVAPTGEIVAQATSVDDEVITFDADFELGQGFRKNVFNFAAHRRPEFYGEITRPVEAAGNGNH